MAAVVHYQTSFSTPLAPSLSNNLPLVDVTVFRLTVSYVAFMRDADVAELDGLSLLLFH